MRAVDSLADPAEDLFEMANLSPTVTGLPMVVWISERGGARHDVRVKVSLVHGRRTKPDLTTSVSVRPEVRVVVGSALDGHDLALVRRWVELNRDALVAYWDGDLLTDEVIGRLRPVTG
jgi:hypothetical protein